MISVLEVLLEWREVISASYMGGEIKPSPQVAKLIDGDGGLLIAINTLIALAEADAQDPYEVWLEGILIEKLGLK
jgi:hypothetical protein